MKLHLGLESHKEITEHEFESYAELYRFICDITHDKSVWLFAVDGLDIGKTQELVIVQELFYLKKLIIGFLSSLNGDYYENFHLQEYPSFEEAYKVALDMQETSPLCYNKE